MSLRGRRVLVADAKASTRWSRVGLLRQAGARVTEARDGVEALAVARSQPTDLIVADAELPRLDGLGLCAAVREEPDLASVGVVLVGDGRPPQALWAPDSGPAGLIEALLAALSGRMPAPPPPAGPPRPAEGPRSARDTDREATSDEPTPAAALSERENIRAQSTVALYREPSNRVADSPRGLWRSDARASASSDADGSGFAPDVTTMSRIFGFGFIVLVAATAGVVVWGLTGAGTTSSVRDEPAAPPPPSTDTIAREAEPEAVPADDGRGVLKLDGPRDVLVIVDGIERGRLPLTLRLGEGVHQVRYVTGERLRDRFVFVKTGTTRTLPFITQPGGFVDPR